MFEEGKKERPTRVEIDYKTGREAEKQKELRSFSGYCLPKVGQLKTKKKGPFTNKSPIGVGIKTMSERPGVRKGDRHPVITAFVILIKRMLSTSHELKRGQEKKELKKRNRRDRLSA